MKGLIHDVRGFDVALTPDEMRQLSSPDSGLLWFSGDGDHLEIDASGNPRHGRLHGGPQFVIDESHPLARGMTMPGIPRSSEVG